jgi:hypothetical protein
MFLITVNNANEDHVNEMNNEICEALSGWKAFKENEVMVTPVVKNDATGNYGFSIFVGPDKPDQTSAPWIDIDDIDEAYRK